MKFIVVPATGCIAHNVPCHFLDIQPCQCEFQAATGLDSCYTTAEHTSLVALTESDYLIYLTNKLTA